MPIHDRGYRHWSGAWTSHPYRGWVIARQGIALLTGRRWFLLLMILSALPFLVRSVILYLATVLGNLPMIRIDARFFQEFLSQQLTFVFPIAIFAGAGLVANDLKANALQIYLSKPITRRDYLLGKLGVLVFFLTLPTLVPGLLLFLLAVVFRTDFTFLREHAWVPLAIAAYSAVIVAAYALPMLALSSMTRSARFAGMAFAGLFLASSALDGILRGTLRTQRAGWVSLPNDVLQLGAFLFGAPPLFRYPIWSAALVLAGVACAAVAVAVRRIRAVEVVE